MNASNMAGTSQLDQSAVAAVRGGDPERYRELVERYERRVFAVAWSRLGDATLAEEAAQEAFIRGYRRLWLLGDGAKFAAWITTITRHAAINLGLRHRRELNKRERWALEQPAATSPTAGETTEICPPETLRQTLAELPAAHRECLVLFYLEGKSGAEAAATLGISEAALRVRLHRARAAMRERLEEKLEGSLEKLRPTKTLVSAVMAAVLASSSAKAVTAGGAGVAIFGTLAKFTPFKWLFMFLPMIMPALIFLPGYLMQLWRLREELKNYRDPHGFRARLHRQLGRKQFGAFVLMAVLALAMGYLFGHGGVHLDSKIIFLLGGVLGLRGVFVTGRLLEINRSRFQVGAFVSSLVMTGAFLAVGFGLMPTSAIVTFCLVAVMVSFFSYNEKPLRMDHNLFLRAAEGMFPGETPIAEARTQTREGIRRFARFLGERRLVIGFRWLDDGLMLHLPRVGQHLLQSRNSYASASKKHSVVVLNRDGSVSAHCGEKDAAALLALADSKRLDLNETENRVAAALQQAWCYFEAGEDFRAEFALGQVPDEEIFIKPKVKLVSTRILWSLLFGCALLMVGTAFWRKSLTGSFQSVSLQAQSKHNYKEAMSDLQKAKTEEQRFYALDAASKESFVAGKIEDSRNFAQELMSLMPKYKGNWNYGNAVQDANLVLGRIAVREGDIGAAKKHLIAAGNSPGSPVMDSFGPNMTLAKDLLEKGERDSVLEYFDLCRGFWKLDRGKLDEWKREVMNGKVPDFGPNLLY